MLGVVVVMIGLSLLPMRIARLVPLVGAVSRVVLLGGFTLAVVAYAVHHGVHGIIATTLGAPSLATFTAVVPVLLYNYLGFDVPATARVRRRPRHQWRDLAHGCDAQPVGRPSRRRRPGQVRAGECRRRAAPTRPRGVVSWRS